MTLKSHIKYAPVLFLACTTLLSGRAIADSDEADDRPKASSLEQITVVGEVEKRSSSGTKLDIPLIETPQAVSVISAETMRERGVVSVQEALMYNAGVRSGAYGLDGRVDSYNVRGNSPAQYLDGMRTAYGVYNVAKVDPYALERVEVLRGPSSVLYGQGTVAGVVNLTSKRPLFTQGGEIGVSYGTHDRKQVQADITGPITDKLAYRVTGMLRKSDTQVDYIHDDRWYIAPSLTLRPGDDTEITVLVHRQEDDTGSTTQFLPWNGTIFDNVNGKIAFNRFVGEPDFEKYASRQTNVSTFISHKFNDWIQVRQNARASRSTVDYQTMYPNSYSNPTNPFVQPGQPGYTGPQRSVVRYIAVQYPKVTQYTIDNQVQLDFTTGPLKHVVLGGLDAQDYKQKTSAATALTTPIDLYASVYGNYVRPTAVPGNTTKQQQLGLYLQDQIKLGGFNLLLGYRHDDADAQTITPAKVETKQTDSANTKRAALLYTFEGGIAPYVSYSESFLPVAGANLAGVAFVPQKGKQWEAGVKYQPNATSLLTVALFDLRDTNRVTTSPTNPLDRVQTGEVKGRGVEFEGSVTIADVYSINANYSYLDSYVSKSNVATEIGKPLASVPKYIASLWVTRAFTFADQSVLRFGVGVRYTGESKDRNTAATFTLTTPSITQADAMVSYERDAWRLAVNAQNLTDKAYYATCLTRGDCFIGARRTVVGSVTRRF